MDLQTFSTLLQPLLHGCKHLVTILKELMYLHNDYRIAQNFDGGNFDG